MRDSLNFKAGDAVYFCPREIIKDKTAMDNGQVDRKA
jgi:hypothetical protein